MVLEAVEEDEGWATNRVTPGKYANQDDTDDGIASQLARQLAARMVSP
jgi:hypothetical protein